MCIHLQSTEQKQLKEKVHSITLFVYIFPFIMSKWSSFACYIWSMFPAAST